VASDHIINLGVSFSTGMVTGISGRTALGFM